MKKLVFFFALLLTTCVAVAQEPVFSVKAGLGIANWYGSDADDAKAKFAYKFGVGMEMPFTDVWSLQTGLNFVSKGTKMEAWDGEEFFEAEGNQLYLELPVMAAARIAVSDQANLVLSAGPYLAYGVGGKTDIDENYHGDVESYEVDTFGGGDDALGLRRFDWGLGIGAAAEFGQLVVGLEGQFGLNKLHKHIKTKNLSAFLTVGYKF